MLLGGEREDVLCSGFESGKGECMESTFASLLRRSKFASYDPKISQIYTTYGGHAHRGQWGLKRPLALKRKSGGFIIVKSVDSGEQQTEWIRAEQEARWLKSFSELGKEVGVRSTEHYWYRSMGHGWQKIYDSDYNFHPGLHSRYGPNILKEGSRTDEWLSTRTNRMLHAQVANPLSMDPRHFRRFVSKLRGSRRKFLSFVESELQTSSNKKSAFTASAQRFVQFDENLHRSRLIPKFLRDEASKAYTLGSKKSLLPVPHHNAALSYPHTTDLTNKILHSPVPGRIFTPLAIRDYSYTVAGVAGILGRMSQPDDGVSKRRPTKLSDMQGHATPVELRTKLAILLNPPQVIDTPDESSGFKSSSVEVEFVDDFKTRQELIPYPPGSQNYISHDDAHARSSKRGESVKMESGSRKKKLQDRKKKGGLRHQAYDRVNTLLETMGESDPNYSLF